MLHYFNPGHEAAILNGSPYYHAPANVVQMQGDLAFLPAWYASDDDCVLVNKNITNEFIEFWSALADFSVKPIIENRFLSENTLLKGQEVALWGISPQSIHSIAKLNEKFDLDLKIPNWNPLLQEFSHRQKAADYLQQLVDSFPFISQNLLPRFCHSLDEIKELLSNKDASYLAKAPYSSSGRGLLWLPSELTQTEVQILHGYLKRQSTVSIEKVVDKKVDFAMEFYCDGVGGCHFFGYSLFETNKGNYAGNTICPQQQIIEKLSKEIPLEQLLLIQNQLQALFEKDIASFYKGYVGVDMMIYEEEIEMKLHPCVEINLRTNMGVLSIAIQQKHVHPEAHGNFQIEYFADSSNLANKHLELLKIHPAHFENGKMRKGYFPLCPVADDTKYLAYLLLE